MIAMSRPLGSNVEMLIRNLFGRKNFNWPTQSGLLISLLLCGVLFAQNASVSRFFPRAIQPSRVLFWGVSAAICRAAFHDEPICTTEVSGEWIRSK